MEQILSENRILEKELMNWKEAQKPVNLNDIYFLKFVTAVTSNPKSETVFNVT